MCKVGHLRHIAASIRRHLHGVGLPSDPPPLIPHRAPTPAGRRAIRHQSKLHCQVEITGLLNLREAPVGIEDWRQHYNQEDSIAGWDTSVRKAF